VEVRGGNGDALRRDKHAATTVEKDHARHRLPQPFYRGPRSYFLTICAADRRKRFADAHLVALLVGVMGEQFRSAGFAVYAYCFMPDHSHILAVGLTEGCGLAKAVRAFKGIGTVRARRLGIRNLWQSSYYDRILRSSESFDAVAAYIFENPVRAGLVKDAHEWPFSGSFMFDWKGLKTQSKGSFRNGSGRSSGFMPLRIISRRAAG
jgi:putative transposase